MKHRDTVKKGILVYLHNLRICRASEVVCYKGNKISYLIAKNLIKVKYICLVNLIMDKPVIKELIQNDLTPENIKQELDLLLTNHAKQRAVLEDYDELRHVLALSPRNNTLRCCNALL